MTENLVGAPGKCNADVVDYFVNGGTTGSNHTGSLFIRDNILYSYGNHWPLMVRQEHWSSAQFLLNADKYSVTTSQHTSLCWRTKRLVMLSFGMLGEAGIDYTSRDFDLVETREAFNESTGFYKHYKLTGETEEIREHWYDGEYHNTPRLVYRPERKAERITARQLAGLSSEEQDHCEEITERRPSLCVFSYKTEDGIKYYVSGMDDQSYFISELPGPVESVTEAEEMLKPLELQGFTGKATRQGEWFFVKLPTDQKTANKAYKGLEMRFVLPGPNKESCTRCEGTGETTHTEYRYHDQDGNRLPEAMRVPVTLPCEICRGRGHVFTGGNPHTATRGGFLGDIAFPEVPDLPFTLRADSLVVSGQITHPEHRTKKLSKLKTGIKLFVALQNRAVASWSSGPLGLNID
jgi:hypothetical protein